MLSCSLDRQRPPIPWATSQQPQLNQECAGEGVIVVQSGTSVTTDRQCGPVQVTTVLPCLTRKPRCPAVLGTVRSPDAYAERQDTGRVTGREGEVGRVGVGRLGGGPFPHAN